MCASVVCIDVGDEYVCVCWIVMWLWTMIMCVCICVCESGDDMYVVFLMVWLVDGVVDGNDECCLMCDW